MALKFIERLKNLWSPKNTPTPQADPKLIRHLKKQPLFKHAPDTVLTQIAAGIKTRSLDKGEVLLRKDDPSESLFIIRTGWFKIVSVDIEGKEATLNQYGPGQVIGELALMDRKPRSNSVIALRPAEVMEIEYNVVLEAINQHPILAVSLLQEMFSRVRFATAYIEESIEWCRHISTGNYDFVQKQVGRTQSSTIIDVTQSHQARASAFLSVFFKMVEGVKEREERLKLQVQQLSIEIDEVKRQKTVAELTETEFFEDLQATAQKLRQKRQSELKKPSEPLDAGEE